ncbi:N-formylglutamate amidohydrolase [Carboxylicivirga sp. M1479]|uniref:N-formylglutamate amidohydrolase n=1 Tax=Carboxylicivirga sp. M1479 TaxID=2594476 RepID=UPI0011789072|nr:N-formylglutamate amidohydrolase [Carboxylicivirga sp. M1479]TRX70472.1 N-formylglutamate amidohydrolase [Carboxylicivirga sp. M1479]
MSHRTKMVVLSCEHGGNEVPEKYRNLFKNAVSALNSHRGYDIGAKELFDLMNFAYIAHRQCATTSRLLVDINRSLHRRTLFSEFTKNLAKEEKKLILENYYYAFRKPFDLKIQKLWSQNKTVLHLSVHSFTPMLNNKIRQTDFGILYNPERKEEKHFAKLWKDKINEILPDYRVRFNYPFRGKPDGHVRYFRDREQEKYLGIEFEMNQKYAHDQVLLQKIARSFNRAVEVWMTES